MAATGDCGATLTVRLVRSLEHRNVKHVVFKEVDLNQRTAEFMELVNKGMIITWQH